jgi:hypothetical protein
MLNVGKTDIEIALSLSKWIAQTSNRLKKKCTYIESTKTLTFFTKGFNTVVNLLTKKKN